MKTAFQEPTGPEAKVPAADPSPRWALAATLCLLPIALISTYFGQPGRGITAWGCASFIAVGAKFCGDVRRGGRFWATVGVVVLLHVPVVVFFPVSMTHGTVWALLPLFALDWFLIYHFIRFFNRPAKPDSPPGP